MTAKEIGRCFQLEENGVRHFEVWWEHRVPTQPWTLVVGENSPKSWWGEMTQRVKAFTAASVMTWIQTGEPMSKHDIGCKSLILERLWWDGRVETGEAPEDPEPINHFSRKAFLYYGIDNNFGCKWSTFFFFSGVLCAQYPSLLAGRVKWAACPRTEGHEGHLK